VEPTCTTQFVNISNIVEQLRRDVCCVTSVSHEPVGISDGKHWQAVCCASPPYRMLKRIFAVSIAIPSNQNDFSFLTKLPYVGVGSILSNAETIKRFHVAG
jgi:hypothetical protein